MLNMYAIVKSNTDDLAIIDHANDFLYKGLGLWLVLVSVM